MLTQEEYEARRQARYQRLLTAAQKAAQDSGALLDQARQMAAEIPFGQPILVGHHSEKSDRGYRARIDGKQRRGYELHKQAEALKARAQAIAQNSAIFSDDPVAVEKLGGKIAQLEARQARMKAVNALVRKDDRAGLADLGYTDAQIERLLKPEYWGRGYPSFEISNNAANIRRLKARAATVAAKQALKHSEETINGVTIEYAPSENRIRAYFPERVSDEVYAMLKGGGFRWAPSHNAFSAYHNANAQHAARLAANAYGAK